MFSACVLLWRHPQGMGVLDKVVLVFNDSDVFWDKTVDFVVMAPPDWSGKW